MPGIVHVACKIPNGLVLEISDLDWTEVDGTKVAVPRNRRIVTLNGSAAQRRLDNNGQITGEVGNVAHGFGLTPVDADFWERWMKENPNYAPLQAGMVFAHHREAEVRAEAKDKRGKRTGLEPMDPPNFDRAGNPVGELDPRLPRGANIKTLGDDPAS